MEQLSILDPNKFKHVHFIGIGGISMSGLAEILLNLGFTVSGSDIRSSNITSKLEKKGIKIYTGHSEENIKDADLVVYTAAVKSDNPELAKAKSLGIPTLDRATLLGEIMKKYPFSVAVSGTHGKTTTTSMISLIMLKSALDPTIHIGGELDAIGGNTRIGSNKYFVAEACEYVESFLKFHPYLAVVLNIEADHLDYFKDIEHIKNAFLKFIRLVPENGYVVACADDQNVLSILKDVHCNIITFGLNSKNAMWTAEDISFNENGFAAFTVLKDNERITNIQLKVPGIHNISNALASIAACYALGCSIENIKKGLESYTGIHRRFELKGIENNIKVVDDYAHHPSEIKATLKAARSGNYPRIWTVFQPHTYTRTKFLLDEFSKAFKDTDKVIITDIYSAREKDTGEIHSRILAEKIRENGQDAIYLPDFEGIVEYLKKNASPGDLIITMGAGDVYKVGEMFLKDKQMVAVS
ncbi:MAG TPA: UDP-N-acetylmuramate--L-alanine ligase [Hungateiclostridium thermocellum]|uniref:UDP-N-acetylmuramate--L-alanine ligase n=2 Tax=Acetivibrio thermocellus TaxID=1515 RepID=MURC_ACET2|nr:UDP-N-acetylmuramate--L-alanine ligase [Acetivibrio thermocellus]A3DIP6.1 RecName: Full=UDP-N-acetylmuramate--L-alanine ligase; AltName: Full=UDP-N-acetylmuramoyl-L-alanine synthetase [Acetivibrio thermocellus ATCC 27405]CDG37089.1 UDP-N-acetylmuramate-L-alanine ligase [Acetivibrio thermocellus BC1]ABN53825.1 UDP-N-acetylmuramate/alanine ligase [Acetivibrio thermocellus ATCC 27405]ADU73308.1 UDP-N-acetylmuramate/alanine ligase [Acetivibrio thermocellus DSM 1313]ALX07226.1 UDP-N-acetylmurama